MADRPPDTIAETIANPAGKRIFMVGIKGTGMAALAEILAARGAILAGSDVGDVFYTDALLMAAGVTDVRPFSPDNVDSFAPELVVHSSAYQAPSNPELERATRKGIACIEYPAALGALSRGADSSAVAGVHGKTTTTALAGTIARECALPATVVVGSAVGSFDGRATLMLGDRYLIAETCEYRRHFMAYEPSRILLTSVESDHQDFFPTYESIRDAFVDFAMKLPPGGPLVYCADDRGACEVAALVAARCLAERRTVRLVPYGETAEGDFRMDSYSTTGDGRALFSIAGLDGGFELHVPGRHIALDAVGAVALVSLIADGMPKDDFALRARRAVAAFRGSKRRAEFVGESDGVVFIDDYAHHPTAITETLKGLRSFYPKRRIVVDFMSHTYSRTKALFGEFSSCFGDADEVILHRIYASAREAPDASVSGRSLFEEVRKHHPRVRYFEDPLDALDPLSAELRPGDLFVTMGAGDNWKLGLQLLERRGGVRKERES